MHPGVGKQCEETCALEGGGKTSLVLGEDAGLAAGFDLGAVRKEAPQTRCVLVVNDARLVHAEGANLAARPEVTSAPAAFTAALAPAFTATLAPAFTADRALRPAG